MRVGLVAALLLAVPAAWAGLGDVVFRIEATTAAGSASWEVTQDQGVWQYPSDGSSTYDWLLTEVVELKTQGGSLLGTLDPNLGAVAVHYASDPVVNLNFAVQAGDQLTEFRITSSTLSFPTMNGLARASASFSVVDAVDFPPFEGATLTGATEGAIGGRAYLSQYNGGVPNGTNFAEQIALIDVLPGDSVGGDSFEQPGGGAYTPIGSVSDMSAEFQFTLTAFDVASGSSTYEIIPEPASFLLVIGLALVRRR